jgi:hypothetical protein
MAPVARTAVVRATIAAIAAVALAVAAPSGSASASGPARSMPLAAGLGLGGVADVGLGWSAPGVRGPDRIGAGRLPRPRG